MSDEVFPLRDGSGGIRTPAEDKEVMVLLRNFDRLCVRLWELGVDTSPRVTQVLRGAELDGVRRGSGRESYGKP